MISDRKQELNQVFDYPIFISVPLNWRRLTPNNRSFLRQFQSSLVSEDGNQWKLGSLNAPKPKPIELPHEISELAKARNMQIRGYTRSRDDNIRFKPLGLHITVGPRSPNNGQLCIKYAFIPVVLNIIMETLDEFIKESDVHIRKVISRRHGIGVHCPINSKILFMGRNKLYLALSLQDNVDRIYYKFHLKLRESLANYLNDRYLDAASDINGDSSILNIPMNEKYIVDIDSMKEFTRTDIEHYKSHITLASHDLKYPIAIDSFNPNDYEDIVHFSDCIEVIIGEYIYKINIVNGVNSLSDSSDSSCSSDED